MDKLTSHNLITPSLIRAGIIFISILVVVLIGVSYSYVYLDNTDQQQHSASRSMQTWRSKINSSVADNQIIDQFEKNFVKLIKQGVVGKEERLSWFETIQNTADRRGMPSVKYSISSQKLLKEDNIRREFPGINVYKSTMMLNVKMGHEGDLFSLLNDLEKAKGLFAVDKCTIEKINLRKAQSTNNMKAYCELGWYTFRHANKT